MDQGSANQPAEATSEDVANIFGSTISEPLETGKIPATIFSDPVPTGPIPPPPTQTRPEAPSISAANVDQVEKKQAERKTLPIRARTESGTNWTAAFLLFAKGVSLKQIADEFDIKFATLLKKSEEEDWDTLVKKHSAAIVAAPPKPLDVQLATSQMEVRAKRIQENRENHFVAADSLRCHIEGVFSRYAAENAFLRPNDILTLVKALKVTQEISSIALGDEFAVKGADNGKGSGSNVRPIIITLPAAYTGRVMKQAKQEVDEIPDPPENSAPPAEGGEAVLELSVVGPKLGEARPTAGKRHSIDFAAMKKNVVRNATT